MNHSTQTLRHSFIFLLLALFFILAGGVLFGSLERWNFVTGVYFSFCSATTVGFGDYYPTHYLSRLFCLLMFLVPLLHLALVV